MQGAPDYPPYAKTEYGQPPGGPPPRKPSGGGGEWRNRALITAAFVLGVGAGVWFTEDVNLYPNNVASTELIDRKTPNSELCMSSGYSSMVFDQRLFVTFNPCVALFDQMLLDYSLVHNAQRNRDRCAVTVETVQVQCVRYSARDQARLCFKAQQLQRAGVEKACQQG